MSSLTEAQKRQISDGKVKSLIKAGIGTTYHAQRLRDFPKAAQMVAWLEDSPRSAFTLGRGMTIVGSSTEAYTVTMLFGMATHLMGYTTVVVPLTRLVAWISNNSDDLDRAADATVLCVTNFYQVYPGGRQVLTGWQIAAVESFLCERLDNAKTTCLHLAAVDKETWWSSAFLQLVAKHNTTVTVG